MLIPLEILDRVRDNPVEGAVDVCHFVQDNLEEGPDWSTQDHAFLLEGYALISALGAASKIEYGTSEPVLSRDIIKASRGIAAFLRDVSAELIEQANAHKLESLRNHFTKTIVYGFSYEFTDGDLKRVQELINELRDLVTENTELEADHKRRLLKRLEEMQSELHKKVSDFDRYYGLAVDAGVLMKKLGENAKPFVDRIKELTRISWATQSRAENLPSGSEPPLLGNDPEPPALD